MPAKTGKFLRKAETHISEVYIYEKSVFKIKKPVKMDFLDFSDLSKRHFFCEEEVRLNRRTCREIYIGTFPVMKMAGSGEFYFDPFSDKKTDGEIIEYCVVMKHLSEDGFLKNRLDKNSFPDNQKLLKMTADHLLDFYRKAEPAAVSEDVYFNKVRGSISGNFPVIEEFYKEQINIKKMNLIKEYTESVLRKTGLKERLTERFRSGRVRDLHGDLHLEHIHISPDNSVCIYDCTEFSKDFRTVDFACDLSFLAMDLEFRGFCQESVYIQSYMAQQMNDSGIRSVFPFFKLYRAMVRAKVGALSGHYEESAAYLGLALRIMILKQMPAVIVVSGFPGSGKSFLSAELASALGSDHISSDSIRKEISSADTRDRLKRTPDSQREALYTPGISDLTYAELFHRCREAVVKNGAAVADASFMSRARREEFLKKSKEAGIHIIWTEVYADESVIKERLEARKVWDDPGKTESDSIPAGSVTGRETDARLGDFDMLRSLWEDMESDSMPEIRERIRFATDTGMTSDDLILQISNKGDSFA